MHITRFLAHSHGAMSEELTHQPLPIMNYSRRVHWAFLESKSTALMRAKTARSGGIGIDRKQMDLDFGRRRRFFLWFGGGLEVA